MVVLFIDDEKNVLNSIRRSLNRWFKEMEITPIMVTSAKEALTYVRDNGNNIAVIVSDQKMPDIKGNELLKLIQKKYPAIVSMILSGNSDVLDLQNMVQNDVFSYISKPWDPEKLKSEIGRAIGHYKIKNENRLLKERINLELQMAAEFQETIMSSTLKQNIPIPITVTSIPSPSTGVTGDYYEIIPISKNKIVLLTGDVSGHGIKPAFVTMALKSIISYEYFNKSDTANFNPINFVSWLNKRLYNYLKPFPDLFLTLSCLFINLEERILTLANAGQPPLLLLNEKREEEILCENIVLGVDIDAEFRQVSVPFTKKTKLFLCSDGIYPSGNESVKYKKENFIQLLSEYREKIWDHKGILDRLKKEYIKNWDDDLTLISIDFDKIKEVIG